jgi:hypothetical protein
MLKAVGKNTLLSFRRLLGPYQQNKYDNVFGNQRASALIYPATMVTSLC